jgi:MerR family transcriptional regulator, heat shock protein HspR
MTDTDRKPDRTPDHNLDHNLDRTMDSEPHHGSEQGVYAISVAAELLGVGVQTLRLYEARGLVTPSRTEGGTRRYSEDDLARMRRVTALLDEGVNLTGAGRVMDLEDENERLRAER